MKNVNGLKLVLSGISLLILISGCSTIKVPMRVTHPAEINMTRYKQIAIGDIDGNLGRPYSDGIKNGLVESGRFKVVDRSRMKGIMAELNLSQSDLSDSKNRVKLGKILSASALITGHTEGSYKEGVTRKKHKCGTKKKGYYACTRYERRGKYRTSGSIDVVDVETGQIVKSKVLNASTQDYEIAYDEQPAAIDKGSLGSLALSRNIATFLKAIAPWSETIQAPFIKDSDIPALERGINQARIGDLDKAIKTFALAAKAAEGNPEITPKTISKAYFNLGLANNFSWKFDAAITAFKNAFELHDDGDYIRWMRIAEGQKKERKELEAQGALSH